MTAPLFVCSLGLLLLNDFVFKSLLHNWFSGKLSDFAGLFAFVLFWSAIFPRRRGWVYALTALGFVFWKSPYSAVLINSFNSVSFFSIGRVVDYTDLIALAVLPAAWFYEQCWRKEKIYLSNALTRRLAITATAFVSLFAFTATSIESERNIFLDSKYVYNGSQESFDRKLRELPDIARIKVQTEAEKFADSNIVTRNDTFYYNFEVKHQYCESKQINVSTVAVSNFNSVHLTRLSLQFFCQDGLNEQAKQEIIKVFEDKFVNPLGLVKTAQ